MIIPIQIEKETAEDCTSQCLFLQDAPESCRGDYFCSLFSRAVYISNGDRQACHECQRMFERTAKKEGEK